MKINISVRSSLILFSLALVWGTHLLLAPSFYILSEKTFLSHARDIMDNISDFTKEQSYNHLDKAKSAVSLTKQLLSANVVNDDIHSIENLEHYFYDQLNIYPHLAGIYIGFPSGDFFYVSRSQEKIENGFRTKIVQQTGGKRHVDLLWRDENFSLLSREEDIPDVYDPRTRPWYIKAREHGSIIWTSPYIFFTSQKPGVTIAGPFYGMDDTLKGIVGVDIDIMQLSAFIGKLRVGKNGQAFILHENGDVIAHRDLAKYLVSSRDGDDLRLPTIYELGDSEIENGFAAVGWQPGVNMKEKLQEPKFTTYKSGGDDYVAMFTPFPDNKLPWIIGMYMPEKDYLGAIKDNRMYSLIATIVLSVLISLVAIRFARALIRPIVCLQQEAATIESRDLELTSSCDSVFRELQETGEAFRKMKISIAGYRDQLRSKEEIYRAITKSASDAIILINENRQISYFNPAAEKLFALSFAEVVGENVHDVIGISWDAVEFDPTGNLDSSEHVGADHVEVEFNDSKGKNHKVEVTLAGVDISNKIHTVAIFRDVSERSRVEALKKQLVQDLHDGIGGNLVNIKLLAQMAENGNITRPVDSVFGGIAEICDDSILEIRSYMDILDAREITWQTLLAELHHYCARTAEAHSMEFIIHSDITGEAVTPSAIFSLNLFKIIKEGMTNIIRHANASSVKLDVQVRGDSFQCTLVDNGSGISDTRRRGRGLLNMENRARQLGATLAVLKDRGTVITFQVPMQEDRV